MATGRRASITVAIHKELNLWWYIIESLVYHPTHLREIHPNEPTWIREMYASLEGIGSVCLSPTREWHVWIFSVDTSSKRRLLTDGNPGVYLTINDL